MPEPAAPAGTPAAATAPGSPTFTAPPEAPGARPAPATPTPKQPVRTQEEILAAATANKPASPAVKPPAAAPATPAAKAPPARPPVATSPAAGPAMVQIGAFSTAQLAEQSWNGVASKIPGRIAGKTLKIEKAEVDGKTVNRALIGGFSSKADADSFCAALIAQGGDCRVR